MDFAQAMDLSDRIKTLDLLSDAYLQRCYTTVIVYGADAQTEFRHKTFHILKEAASVFIPIAPAAEAKVTRPDWNGVRPKPICIKSGSRNGSAPM